MWASRLAGALKNSVEPMSQWSAAASVVAVIASVLLVVTEVTLRSLLKVTLPGTIEVISFLLIIIFFGAMPYCEINKKNIRVDILVNSFSPTARLVTTLCGNLIALGIISIISWQSVEQGMFSLNTGLITGMLRVPIWPFAILTAVFMALFSLAVLANSLEYLGELIGSGSKNCLWLIPGIIATLALFGMSLWPGIFLPVKIEPYVFGVIAILLLFLLIFLHVHIGAAMAIVTLLGMNYLSVQGAGLTLLGMTSQTTASNYIWSVAPLFLWMGFLVAAAGFSRDLYRTAYTWLGRLPGGLASATVAACGAFSAVVGECTTGVLTMSSIALPQMKAYKYDSKLATGSLCAGSSIGILIPPSLGFIVYGMLVEQSIGRLFIAGIIPGIILTLLFILYVSIRCRINPRLGPAGPATTFREKVISLKYSWGVLILFLVVMGGIYLGIFTATEAGAIGAFGALVIGLSMRRLTFKTIIGSAMTGVQMGSMIFFIFIYAISITQFFALTQLTTALAELISGLAVHRYVILSLILLMLLILGCLMNALPVIILTLPIIYPTVIALGFDPIWFGVLIVIMVQVGTLTPPIGVTVFAMAGVSDVPMYTIFRGVLPFWVLILSVVAILAAFPQITLFLPNLMMGD